MMWRFGSGDAANVYLGDGTLVSGGEAPPANLGAVVFTTSGGTFAPELDSDSPAQWQSMDGAVLANSLAPVITGHEQVRLYCDDYASVHSLNLGFDHTQDAGRYNLGASYDKAPTDVTGITGLENLSGLRYFMAANTELAGTLNFSGMTNLQYIECYEAKVQGVVLTGCSSLVRLCLEACEVRSLDVNPVRHTLRDLRAASQGPWGPQYSLTFAPLDGPLDLLYHYCVRDQTVHGLFSLAELPSIYEYWCWNTDQTQMLGAAISPDIGSVLLYENAYDQASVDLFITSILAAQTHGGRLDLSDAAAPSTAVTDDLAALRAAGWTVLLGQP